LRISGQQAIDNLEAQTIAVTGDEVVSEFMP